MKVSRMIVFLMVPLILTMGCLTAVDASSDAPTVGSAQYADEVLTVSGTASGEYVKMYVVGEGYQSEYAFFLVKSGQYSGIFRLGELPVGTYRAVAFDNNGSNSLEFKVIGLDSISIEPAVTLLVGEDTVLETVLTPADASFTQTTWSSSDSSVATVDGDGRV